MATVTAELRYAPKDAAWFTANAAMVLKDGEPAYLRSTGEFKLGDGVTALSALSFLPVGNGNVSTVTATNGTGQTWTITNPTTTPNLSLALTTQGITENTNLYYTNARGIGSVLTGYVSGAGTITSADTVLSAIQKLNGNIGAISTSLVVGTTAITSGTTTRILYNNAGVLGEYLVTGTGTTAVLSTSPTFTTSIIVPKIIGGTGTTQTLTYQTTSGVGATGADHIFLVGNNGATQAMRIYNTGNVSISNTVANDALHVGAGTSFANINLGYNGVIGSSTGGGALGSLGGNAHGYYLPANGAGSSFLVNRLAGQTFNINAYNFAFDPSGTQSSGAWTLYNLSVAANTGQTTTANIPNFKLTGNTKTWSAGTVPLQYFSYFSGNTMAFASASTATLAANLVTDVVTGGTNATITTAVGFYNVATALTNYTTGYGALFNAPTGSGVNWALGLAGDTVVTSAGTKIQFSVSNAYITNPGSNMRIAGGEVFIDAAGSSATIRTTSTLWQWAAALNMSFSTGTGTKIGTGTNQLFAFWNATPIIQPTTGVAAATFVTNTSLIANDTATFDGYTIGQVVKALRNTGLLA